MKQLLNYVMSFFKRKETSTTAEGAFLPLNLQYFSEPEPSPGQNEPSEPEPSNPTIKDEPTNEPQQKDIMIPKTRFDEVNNKYKTAQDELNKILKQQEQDELDKQKQQGEFEKLYNKATEDLQIYKGDYEKTSSRVEELEGIITSMLNSKLESIPEEFHDLIPENLSPEAKLDWISKADAKGLFKDQSQEPVGGQTNPTAKQTDLESLNVHQLMQSGYKN